MKRAGQFAVVTAGGIVASVLVAALLFTIRTALHYDFYNLFVRMVIPLGAVTCGLVVSIGFIVGARITGYRPGNMLALSALICAVIVHFGLKLLDYLTLAYNGAPLYRLISFPQYVHFTVMNWTTELGGRTTVSHDGGSGYIIEAIPLAGFTG